MERKGGGGKEGCIREENDKGDDCLMYNVTCIHGPLKGSKRGLETMGSMMSREERESPSKICMSGSPLFIMIMSPLK